MLPAHSHDVAGDLLEKFLECPKFWQCSCHIVSRALNSCFSRLVFGIFRSLFLYFVIGLLDSSCRILTKFGCINRDISSVTSSKLVGSISLILLLCIFSYREKVETENKTQMKGISAEPRKAQSVIRAFPTNECEVIIFNNMPETNHLINIQGGWNFTI